MDTEFVVAAFQYDYLKKYLKKKQNWFARLKARRIETIHIGMTCMNNCQLVKGNVNNVITKTKNNNS